MSKLQRLGRRVRRLEDEREILKVLSAYGRTIDYGDVDGFVSCFAEDGVLELSRPQSSEVAVRATGRDELRSFAEGHSRAPHRWHKHVVVDSHLSIGEDDASATSYYVLLQEHEHAPRVRSFGRYLDCLQREGESGQWRLSRRRAEVEAALAGLPPLIGH